MEKSETREEKQMGKFVTDKILEVVCVVCGMMAMLSEHTYGKSLSFSAVGVNGEGKMNFPNVLFYMRNLTFLPSTLTDFFSPLGGWLEWWI